MSYEMKINNFGGLGDVVEAAAKVTGVKAVVDKISEVTGKDCGCGKRKEALNKAVPFKKDPPDDL